MNKAQHTFCDDQLEQESFLIQIPTDTNAILFRATYFPVDVVIARKIEWRKRSPSSDPFTDSWSSPLDLVPVRHSETIQTIVTELPVAALGANPGDTVEVRLIHVDVEDPMSHLLRLDIKFEKGGDTTTPS